MSQAIGLSNRGLRGPTSRGRRPSGGFTLVELLVVITIIGMLMALLLPAIQSAREAGRRNTCSNNMRNCGTALLNVEATRRGFPGYANTISAQSGAKKRASWVIPILRNLERGDIYSVWQKQAPILPFPPAFPTETTASPWAHAYLNILVCPSNPSGNLGLNPLSYVVNCGSALTANDNSPGLSGAEWVEDINSGVFFNQAGADTANAGPNPPASSFSAQGPKVTIDFISTNDGTSNTLMLSENIQSTNWATDPLDTKVTLVNPWQSEFQIKQNTGFVFFVTGVQDNVLVPGSTTTYNSDSAPINGLMNSITTPMPLVYSPTSGGGLAASRPSSAHPGGVNVYFCDNHYRFISEEIEYKVYTQLMTPRQSNMRINKTGATPANPPVGNAWRYILNETDY